MGESSVVVLAFYAGAYGPTVRLDVQAEAPLRLLEQTFRQLASATPTPIRLEAGPGYRVESCTHVLLRTVSRHADSRVMKVLGEPGPSFDWAMTLDEWRDCASKTAKLLSGAAPGHQYLGSSTGDDVLVELAYLEGPRATRLDSRAG